MLHLREDERQGQRLLRLRLLRSRTGVLRRLLRQMMQAL